MTDLQHKHLTTLTLDVDFAGVITIGDTPAGMRRIAAVTGGTFTGERLNGLVRPGTDWVINRPDGAMVIDVRLTLETTDGAFCQRRFAGCVRIFVRRYCQI